MLKYNLLMICSTFPPQSDIGGLRVAMFSKYLPSEKWNIFILTGVYSRNDVKHNTSMKIKGLPKDKNIFNVLLNINNYDSKNIFQKLDSFFRPDYYQPRNFVNDFYNKAQEIINNNNIDIIYATSPDMSCLSVADKIHKNYNIPWVADFRDIIEQDPVTSFREKILHLRIKYRRKMITKSATSIITVSNEHVKTLCSSLSRNVNLLINGYDSEMFKKSHNIYKSDIFTIVYMGRLLDLEQRNPEPLFEAIYYLKENKKINEKQFKVLFYGSEKRLIEPLIKKYNLEKNIEVLPQVDYEKVPDILQKSTLNLILSNKLSKGVLTTKLFEYLAVGRPILCIPNDKGDLSKIIKSLNAGWAIDDKNEISNLIENIYDKWLVEMSYPPISDYNKVSNYSRKNQALELSRLLESVIK